MKNQLLVCEFVGLVSEAVSSLRNLYFEDRESILKTK